MIHVVAGVIYGSDHKILLAQRPPGKSFAGFWEFPGGKLEVGETPQMALHRELQEELDIEVQTAHPFLQLEHVYTDRAIFLDVWEVRAFTGLPRGREGQNLRWVAVADLEQYQFPAANGAIVAALKQYNKSV